MSLHHDLLEQAKHLASREPRRPRQASLRRAVSAAYYALFHLLIDEATKILVSDPNLRVLVSRAFDHSEMKEASKQFEAGNLGKRLAGIAGVNVPGDLSRVAGTFIVLQEARHKADYKLDEIFSRSEVKDLVERADDAFRAWKNVRAHPVAKLYLAALLFHKGWQRWR